MKCLGVDISRPLFEFLTSLSRQPPLVIQYQGCQVRSLAGPNYAEAVNGLPSSDRL
jgi:hypothetical protein